VTDVPEEKDKPLFQDKAVQVEVPAIPVVHVKPGVEFAIIAPGGFAMLSALHQAAVHCKLNLTITSACDGEHSGPQDPHKRGEAYDVRINDLPGDEKFAVLEAVMNVLGWEHFYGFLEDPYTENEHLHFQVRKGTVYP
jgi:hypothetical protein